jgi:hypothetical protein
MKNLLKISLVVMLGLGIMSFYIVGTKKSDVEIIKPTGTKQVFVMSTKKINGFNSKNLTNAFKNKRSDFADSTFEIYEFEFDKDLLRFTHMTEVNAKEDTINLNLIKSNEAFAIYEFKDTLSYFNGIENKLLVLNLNDNPKFPMIQILYKVKEKYHGLYSVDTRDLSEFLNDEDVKIFKQ